MTRTILYAHNWRVRSVFAIHIAERSHENQFPKTGLATAILKTGFQNWFSKTKGAVSPSVLPSVPVQFLQKPQDNPQFLVVFVSFHVALGLGENWEKPVL
jgi:hypothetical protein